MLDCTPSKNQSTLVGQKQHSLTRHIGALWAYPSKHFSGNAALEACLVKDSPHVVLGADVGRTWRRSSRRYSPSMAFDRGLRVHRRDLWPDDRCCCAQVQETHDIINRSYQQQADNIVGKMTIDSLDKGMLAAERTRKFRPCFQPVIGGAARTQVQSLTGGLQSDGQQQLPRKTLAVLFQLVRVKGKLGRHSFARK